MKIIEKVDISQWCMKDVTRHLEERRDRFNNYLSEGLTTSFVDGFVVDKNHINGLEVHIVTEEAFTFIFNLKSKKLITVLASRPQQIKRYYEALNLKCDKNILDKALQNFTKGLNKI